MKRLDPTPAVARVDLNAPCGCEACWPNYTDSCVFCGVDAARDARHFPAPVVERSVSEQRVDWLDEEAIEREGTIR